MPEIPASVIGIARARLSKNVSPPRCPDATRIRKIMKNRIKQVVSAMAHFPSVVFGLYLIFTSKGVSFSNPYAAYSSLSTNSITLGTTLATSGDSSKPRLTL